MKYRYLTCDVFTDTRFGGNPLAVLPDARGLTPQQMQQVTREFNYSETAFVLPPGDPANTRSVRIFTPACEIPFAGHPNVGTAFVLAATGELGPGAPAQSVTFEEAAGLVTVAVNTDDGAVTSCEVSAPQPLSLGDTIPTALVADAVSLTEEDIVTTTHQPQVASVGLPFVVTELRDRATLERARINMAGFEAMRGADARPSIHLYTHADDGVDLRARMFAPLSGVPEDPATGSASCALAGLLAHYHPHPDGDFRWLIAQGVEMGRPSTLSAAARKTGGVVESTSVGGACVLLCEGAIEVV